MEPQLKTAAKACALAAAERVPEGTTSLPVDVVYALIAAEAIEKMLNEQPQSDGPFDEDTTKELKRIRKMLRRRLESAGPVAEAHHHPELGQYVTAVESLGDEKKVDRFARLMGGAKHPTSSATRTTYAASAQETSSRQAALQAQFEEAAARKGKLKGLGR